MAMIHGFHANHSYWIPGRSRSSVEKCIEHSLCFGVYADGRQVAFARVVTDYVRYAHLPDVFGIPEFRGRGISKKLLSRVLADSQLRTIMRFTLGTQNAHGLYVPVWIHVPRQSRKADGTAAPRAPAGRRSRTTLNMIKLPEELRRGAT